jgi:hypothetical protein
MIQSTALAVSNGGLTPVHYRQLVDAVDRLENPKMVARLADYAGKPINAVIRFMPRAVNRRLRDAVRAAIYKCLEVAIESLEEEQALEPADWMGKVLTGVTGGVGGFFGMAALPIELPITTTLMLRSIAEIARAEGEDLKQIGALLACLEVFALGGRGPEDKSDFDYYAVRMMLTKLTTEMAALVLERGAVNASSPIVAKLVGEIVTRFGLVVSDLTAASAVPIVGAFGGATVNVIFMDHFQRIARGHFTVRRLERVYGVEPIRELYHRQQMLAAGGRRKQRRRLTSLL